MYAKHKISSTYILLWDHVNVGCYRTQHFSVVVVHTRTLPFFPHPHTSYFSAPALFKGPLTSKKIFKKKFF